MRDKLVRVGASTALAVCLTLGVASPGWSYLAVKGGLFMPNGDDRGLKHFDNGFGGELAIGGQFSQGPVGFAVDGGIGYFTTETEGGDYDLQVVPLTLTGKLLLKPVSALTLYAGGGLGYYIALLGGDGVEGWDSDDKTGKGLGFHAVGGVKLPFGPLAILAEVRWSKAEVQYGGHGNDVNIGGITVIAGIKF